MKTEIEKRTRTIVGALGTGLLAATVLAAPPPPPAGAPPARPQPGAPQMFQPGMPRAQMRKGAFLGVAVSPVEPALRAQLDLPEGTGLTIAFVDPNGPSKDLLRPYDILTKLNDQILVNAEQLAVLVRMHRPGQKVTLELRRGGKSRTISLKLGEKELPPLSSTFPGPRVIPMPMPGLPGGFGGGQMPFPPGQGPGGLQQRPGGI
ncbi:MAG: PDZ domain-containing protein, partial [Kiritimatiellaeota bacterium]|nr:PDZ domain-containing protein [Kiritimatiellota bacterium]